MQIPNIVLVQQMNLTELFVKFDPFLKSNNFKCKHTLKLHNYIHCDPVD